MLALIATFALVVSGTLIAFKEVDQHFFVSTPRSGGTLTEGILGRPHMINPILAKNDADRDIAALIYSGLYRPDATQGSTGIVPDLASNMSISDDAKTYTVTLKDAKFHDGTPVMASDVVYTVNLINKKEIKSPLATNFLGVTAAATDAKTVVFTLESPLATFPDALTFGILPEHLWKNIPLADVEDTDLPLRPVGSGPYKFKTLARTGEANLLSSYELEAWGEGSRDKPLIENVRFVFFGNDDDRSKALEDGTIDIASGFDADTIAKIDTGKLATSSAQMSRIFGVYFNPQKNALLADPVVRQALDLSLPRQKIVAKVFSGLASPENSAFPGLSKNIDSDNNGELAAHALLEQNGWVRGTDGFYQKEDKKTKQNVTLAFTLVAPEEIPTVVAAADIAALEWKRLGISVTRQSQGSDTFADKVLSPRNFDALFYGEVTGRDPDPRTFWHSKEKSGANIAQYSSKNTDSLIDALAKTTNPSDRSSQIALIASAIHDDRPAVFAYSPNFVYFASPRVHGISLPLITTPADRFAAISKWYVEEERVWKFLKK